MPSCTRHPRWITIGCIIFSIMLSYTIYLSQNRQPRGIGYSDFGQKWQWQWPEMDPYKVMTQEDNENSNISSDSFQATKGQGNPDGSLGPRMGDDSVSSRMNSAIARPGIKTWDIDDPALTLAYFFGSPEWKNQTLQPASDFVNLLRVLRPADHAFFIALFINQAPRPLQTVLEDRKGTSPKISTVPIKGHHNCGSWIPNYVEFQNQVMDKTLPSRYTIHTCSNTVRPMIPATGISTLAVHDPQQQQYQPCGNVFSQILAMASAFAWSVAESRAFFSNPDQLKDLRESFEPSLFLHWTSPPAADSTAKVDTADMTSRDLGQLFQLQDPLFSNHEDGHSENTNSSIGSNNGAQDGQVADEQLQDRLWGLRSKSRNRVGFERQLTPNDPATSDLPQQRRGRQRRLGQRTSPTRMKKLVAALDQDGVELVLDHDILPQFVNTTRTLRLFLNLSLPLPDRLIQQSHDRLRLQNNEAIDGANLGSVNLVRARAPTIHAPSAHGSLFTFASASSLSSATASHEFISAAFHTAIHDERDVSRTHAVPKTFGCLLDILIQPKIELQQLIHPYATLFKLPAIFSIGIYIRPGQSGAGLEQQDRVNKSWKSISNDRKAIVDRYMTCARQIAREFAPKRKGQKVIFVAVSEDPGMVRVMESQEEWDEEVIAPKWILPKDRSQTKQPQHPSISKQQQAVLESWILSKTDFQVVSDHSDFAKVTVWRTRREGRSIVIRENDAIEQEMASRKGYVGMLDCGILLKNLIVTETE
ncbi:hypothetical protein BGZ54_009968 [Gamsiella multidivaricata]|nr:hypothetical protein BGZ54_009968 [Gamsiella multidivaricata]